MRECRSERNRSSTGFEPNFGRRGSWHKLRGMPRCSAGSKAHSAGLGCSLSHAHKHSRGSPATGHLIHRTWACTMKPHSSALEMEQGYSVLMASLHK